jgi:hypothetical protein
MALSRPFLIFFCLLFSFVVASPVRDYLGPRTQGSSDPPRTHVLHERLEDWHSNGWTRIERVDAKAILPMRIGLTQENLDLGHNLLMAM